MSLTTNKASLQELLNEVNALDEFNFSIVAYASEDELPETSNKNTIAVFTSNEITSWAFSIAEPETPSEGMVWFKLNALAPVVFNALTVNVAMMYPSGCLQYVSGAWADRTAKTYQNGEWIEWIRYIFSNGAQYTDVTGGWTKSGYSYYGPSYSIRKPTITETILLDSTTHNQSCIAGTANKINLSSYEKITVICDNWSGDNNCVLVILDDERDAYPDYAVAYSIIYIGTNEIDISNINGEYYIAMNVTGDTSSPTNSATISEVILS